MQKTETAKAVILLMGVTVAVLAPLRGMAQESMLAGLGWHRNSPGTQLDGGSQLQVTGNRSAAQVSASGGKGSALANAGMMVDLAGTAQANSVGVAGMQLDQSSIRLLANEVHGFVNALGGAATANVALVASGEGVKPLASSSVVLQGNQAANVDAFGAKAQVLLGTGSLQMPGRATANGVLLDATEARELRAALQTNKARDVTSIGGSALANALTAARSKLGNSDITQVGNEASEVRAGGGSAGLGRGTLAEVNLTGVAAANAVALASSELSDLRVTQSANRADRLMATGASALVNSLSFSDYRGGRYELALAGNRASDVNAWGGEAQVLRGALADVRMSATALGNSVAVTRGELLANPSHSLTDNTVEAIAARGGAAVANSIWLDDARVTGGRMDLHANQARDVATTGASGSLAGGVVAAFERNGRALANSVAVDSGAAMDSAQVSLLSNEARGVNGHGGLAAANSLLVSEGRAEKTRIALLSNRASDVTASGQSASAGAGVLYSATQTASALVNSLSLAGAQWDGDSLALMGNTGRNVVSRGGIAMANAVALENGDGSASQLSGGGVIAANTAEGVSSAASSASAAGGVVSRVAKARAAVNSLVLHDNALLDRASRWSIMGNDARQVQADGGTALVNTLAAYRGARLQSSTVTLLGNRAGDITARGGASQAMGVGSNSNGVLAANALYMDGNAATGLASSSLLIAGNEARGLTAQGGRITANGLALNGQAQVGGSNLALIGNTAENLRSEGREGTVAGFAAFGKGVGQANANAIQSLAQLRNASVQLMANHAGDVRSSDGLSAANSLVQGAGQARELQVSIVGNRADSVASGNGHTALANSLQTDGDTSAAAVNIAANTQASAEANGRDDALANSVRVKREARVSGTSVAIAANRSTARSGTAASVDVSNSLQAGSITIMGNQGSASGGGVINSVIASGRTTGAQIAILGNRGSVNGGTGNSVRNSGRLAASNITILGNQASVQGKGDVNSVINQSSIQGGQVLIAGNSGSANQGGLVNSVRNTGQISGASITIMGNHGTATGGGVVNSVDNKGQLSGSVIIAGNRGSSTMGGTVNSVVNHGLLTGVVVIAGNQGSAAVGGVTNSLINQGVVTGNVTIVGGVGAAAAGITTGSVRNVGGAITGSAGVVGNGAYAANPGYTYTIPSTGVVNRSVTVLPAVNLISM